VIITGLKKFPDVKLCEINLRMLEPLVADVHWLMHVMPMFFFHFQCACLPEDVLTITLIHFELK